MVSNDSIEGVILIGDGLGVDLLKREGTPGHHQVSPGRIEHARGEDAESDGPAGRNPIYVSLPQQPMTASHFQNSGILRKLQQRIKNPPEPSIRVRAEELVNHDSCIEL